METLRPKPRITESSQVPVKYESGTTRTQNAGGGKEKPTNKVTIGKVGKVDKTGNIIH